MKETNYLKDSPELVKDLMKISILSRLKERDIKNLIKMSKIKTYDTGEAICEEGLNDKWIYFLTKGRVRIVKDGKELSVLDKRGDVFGEMSVIDGRPRSASVYAMETTVCLATDTLYIDKLQDHEKLAFRYLIYRIFAEILSTRLRETSEELVHSKNWFGRGLFKRIKGN